MAMPPVPPEEFEPPQLICIEPDDDCAKHVSRTESGQQFFVTTPFAPATGGDPGREFSAVYRFDGNRRLVELGGFPWPTR